MTHKFIVPIAIAMVFGGCMSNVVVLELLVSRYSGIGNLLTFAQFLFVALEGLLSHLQWQQEKGSWMPTLKKSKTPFKWHMALVTIFVIVSIVNNKALHYHIPMPLHMVLRSGSLIMSYILGLLILGKAFTFTKFISIIVVTIGIVVATLASAAGGGGGGGGEVAFDFDVWIVGIGMLVFALVLSAFLGILQEYIYSNYGKEWKESMFYSHALSLPFFLPFASDMISTAVSITEISKPFMGIEGLPDMWVLIVLNCMTQYICIRGVYTLTGHTDALTCTLTISVRKFTSLLVSIFYFGNPFSWVHWLASFMVFAGTLVYSLTPAAVKGKDKDKKKKE